MERKGNTSIFVNASDLAYTTQIQVFVNNTCAGDGTKSSQSLISQVSSQVLVAFIMIGLGCTCDVKLMWKYMKHPKQLIAGLVLQLFLFPMLGLGLSQVFSFTQAQAMGAIITCSCPGGAFSNVVTYWLDGDMDLSLVLTALSTALALGTMPLWLHLLPLAIGIVDDCLKIPFQELGLSFIGLIVPAFIGVLIKFKFPKAARILSQVFTVGTSLGICVFVVFFFTSLFKGFFDNPPWNVILASVIMPALATALSYLATRAPWLTFSIPARRTIAVETLMQNTALGMSVTFVSYDVQYPFFSDIILFTMCYGLVQLISALLVVLSYLLIKWKGWCVWFLPEGGDRENDDSKMKNKDVSRELLSENDREKSVA